MRWFKHLVATRRDERIARLIDKGGLEYYALWWILLEIIAEQMDKSDRCWAVYSLAHWARLAQTSQRKWANFIKTAQEVGLCEVKLISSDCQNFDKIFTEFDQNFDQTSTKLRPNFDQTSTKLGTNFDQTSGKLLGIKIAKLLKYKDEYSKKSGHTHKVKSGQCQEQDTDTDTDTELINTPPGSPPKGETPTKSKTKKSKTEPPDPRINEFIQKACFEFKKKFGRDYPSGSIPRVARAVKANIGMGVDKLLEAWLKYLNGDFWFDRKTGKSLTIFFNHLPEIITAKTQNRILPNDESLMNLLKGGERKNV